MNAIRTVLVAALGIFVLSGQGKPPTKLQVLIITGRSTGAHDWRATTPVLKQDLEDTGRFEVRVTEEFRGSGPETLAPYDVVVVNYYDAAQPQFSWGERADKALLDFVRSGKGLVLYHFSIAAFDGWTEYEKMSGGNWKSGNGHHSARHDFAVNIKDAGHPIMAGLKPSLFVQNDELYANLKWQPEGSYHVLATAYDDHSLYDERASDARNKQPMSGPGINEPILWTTQYGDGRVFVTTLGHDSTTLTEPTFKVTFTRGVEWAATGNVTLPIPPDMAGQ
jgi:type 1 glutamine amidotransferase